MGELKEDQLVFLQPFLVRQVADDRLRLGEPGGELEHGRIGAGESVALLTEKDICAEISAFDLPKDTS